MSEIKFKAGNDATAQTSRSREIKRTGEGAAKEKPAVGKQSSEPEADKINFSDRAARVGELIDKLKNAPDIRHERVAALRQKIEAGEYNPPTLSIADAILKNETID